MTQQRGAYDDLADTARTEAQAAAVVVVVLDGNHRTGAGYSCREMSTIEEEIAHLTQLSSTLRHAADRITADVRRLRQQRRPKLGGG